MAKSRAQYQQEYRERKKKNDPLYLEKERFRAKGNRKAITSKSLREKTEVRMKNRLYSQKYRDKLKAKANTYIYTNQSDNYNTIEDLLVDHIPSVSSVCVINKQTQKYTRQQKSLQNITVKLPFKTRTQKNRRRRRSKCLRNASYKIKTLENQVESLKREKKTLQKRFYRLNCSNKKQTRSLSLNKEADLPVNVTQTLMTPKSQTKHDLNALRLEGNSRKIVKKLDMSNALLAEVKEATYKSKPQTEKSVIMRIVSGRIMKKYKCLDTIRKQTGLGRKGLKGAKIKEVRPIIRKRLEVERNIIKSKVIQFLERDDVSVQMPGKKDCKSYEGEKKQVRILNDYLMNIFDKFKAENPNEKISRTVFSRLRPKYILLTNLISRNTCLCSKHQNFAMKLKAMRSAGLEISPNPEYVGKNVTIDEMINLLSNLAVSDKVTYEEWQRVNDDDGKKRMKIMKVDQGSKEFKELMRNEFNDFLGHVARVKSQYDAIRQLKANLPEHHVIANMDFAENFTCGNMDEIQSAYWNAASVTLHPVVVYYKDNSGDLKHKNYIFTSDVGNHNATAVYTIMKELVPCIREMLPLTCMLHYWTDSPSSQYRNRHIFNLLIRHKEIFGINARWNYYECGHGKGPCDGLGGVAKRQAGNACKQGKATIQCATDFFVWANDNHKSIEYRFYSQADYDKSAAELNEQNSKVVPGTMKLHAFLPINGEVYTARTSCYCVRCLISDPCEHWEKFQDSKSDNGNNKIKQVDVPVVGSYVLAKYEGQMYVGKLLEVDYDSKDARVSFMEKTKGKGPVPLFRWPSRVDELWVNFSDILLKIDEPCPYGKTKRQYMLHSNDSNIF